MANLTKPVGAKNLTQICQIPPVLGRSNLNRAEPLLAHFIAKFD